MKIFWGAILALIVLSSTALADPAYIPDIHEEFFSKWMFESEEYIVFLNTEAPITKEKSKASRALEAVKAEQTRVTKKLVDKKIIVKKKTQKASNTLLVKGSPFKLEELKAQGIIKSYTKNEKISVMLDESLPFLGVPQVWAENPTSYTGRGVKVAVIDTGVNYNHPSMGGCFGPG